MIAYYNASSGDLKVVHCSNVACTGLQPGTLVDGTGDVGTNLSMTLDNCGNPVISYYDNDNLSLNIARCDDPTCSVASVNPTQTNISGLIDSSIALDPSDDLSTDVPVVSYIDDSNGADIFMRVIRCGDATCTTWDSATPDPVDGEIPSNTSLVLDFDGNPIISRFDSVISQLTVVRCTNPLCTPNIKVLTTP